MTRDPQSIPASPRHRVPASPARRGFTLIEILCVVVIVGLAAGIIIPQIATRDDLRCASAARELMCDLLYAQNRSIALGKMHYVQFSTATNTWQVLDAVTPNHTITNPISQQTYSVTVGTGAMANVSIKTASFDGNPTVAFDSMGIPYTWDATNGPVALASGSVVFKAGTNQKTVTVSPYSGQIKVQ